MTRLPALLSIAILVACTPQSGVVTSDALGLTGSFTAQRVISDDAHHVLLGHVIEVTRDGETVRALVISQRRDGVHRLSLREAWSGGVQLPYRATTRRLDGCTHGHCRDNPVGMIFLSEALFAHAQVHGLRAYLVGRTGNIEIHAPPELFASLQSRPIGSESAP